MQRWFRGSGSRIADRGSRIADQVVPFCYSRVKVFVVSLVDEALSIPKARSFRRSDEACHHGRRPRGGARKTAEVYLCDQIRRAVLSILLNIGEAASEYNPAEKARIFGLARRSAEEVVIGLTVAVRLQLLPEAAIADSIDQADKVMGMLTRIIVYHRNNAQKKSGAVRKPTRPAPENKPELS